MSPQFLRTEVRHFLVLSGDPEFVMLKQDPPPPNPPSSFMCAPTWLLSIKRHLLRKVEKPKRDHEHDQVCHPRGTFWGKKWLPGAGCWQFECFLSQLTAQEGANESKVFWNEVSITHKNDLSHHCCGAWRFKFIKGLEKSVYRLVSQEC